MSNKLKVLVLYAHPDPEESVANKALLEAVKDLDHVTVHDLYATYPDYFIDVTAEQNCYANMTSLSFSIPSIPIVAQRY